MSSPVRMAHKKVKVEPKEDEKEAGYKDERQMFWTQYIRAYAYSLFYDSDLKFFGPGTEIMRHNGALEVENAVAAVVLAGRNYTYIVTADREFGLGKAISMSYHDDGHEVFLVLITYQEEEELLNLPILHQLGIHVVLVPFEGMEEGEVRDTQWTRGRLMTFETDEDIDDVPVSRALGHARSYMENLLNGKSYSRESTENYNSDKHTRVSVVYSIGKYDNITVVVDGSLGEGVLYEAVGLLFLQQKDGGTLCVTGRVPESTIMNLREILMRDQTQKLHLLRVY